MKTIAFIISDKANEKRRALMPSDLDSIKNRNFIYVERGYGKILDLTDEDYSKYGVNIVSREEALKQDIICDPKIGDSKSLEQLEEHKLIFGWIHAIQNYDVTQILIENKLSAIAWEDMFENNRHVFWRNNEIAGEAAVLNAYEIYGKLPMETTVAIMGRGNVAIGAYNILSKLGADITVYDHRTEAALRAEIGKYDVIVNATLWDIERDDHILYKKDLKRMKRGGMIIDVSCDKYGGVETSEPTTMDNPIYIVDGVIHYVVNHTPSIYFKSSTKAISSEVKKYIDDLIEENENTVLKNSTIILDGKIVDKRIIEFQNRI